MTRIKKTREWEIAVKTFVHKRTKLLLYKHWMLFEGIPNMFSSRHWRENIHIDLCEHWVKLTSIYGKMYAQNDFVFEFDKIFSEICICVHFFFLDFFDFFFLLLWWRCMRVKRRIKLSPRKWANISSFPTITYLSIKYIFKHIRCSYYKARFSSCSYSYVLSIVTMSCVPSNLFILWNILYHMQIDCYWIAAICSHFHFIGIETVTLYSTL